MLPGIATLVFVVISGLVDVVLFAWRSWLLFALGGCVPDRCQNFDVRTATAQIVFQGRADILITGIVVSLQKSDGRDDHPVKAIPALRCRLLNKSLLHGVKCIILAETFQRNDSSRANRS